MSIANSKVIPCEKSVIGITTFWFKRATEVQDLPLIMWDNTYQFPYAYGDNGSISLHADILYTIGNIQCIDRANWRLTG